MEKITLPKKHTEKGDRGSDERNKNGRNQQCSENNHSQYIIRYSTADKSEKDRACKSHSYDKNSKTFTFELNGNTFKYPVSAAAIKDLGYIYVRIHCQA